MVKFNRLKQFAQLFLNYKKLKKTTALALENAYLFETIYNLVINSYSVNTIEEI